MINELISFARTHFKRSENSLMQVVLLNTLSFLALLLLKIIFVVAGYESAYTVLLQRLVLPASWSTYIYQPWTLLTYFWVHVSLFPTFWGLLFLYSMGNVVVRHAGNRHFVAIYLLGGLAGGFLFLFWYHITPYFQGTGTSLLGFSGSLYAVMVAAATLAPQLSFSFLLLPPLKFKYIAGCLVLLSLVNLVGAEPATSIANLGGAWLGYVYARWCQRGNAWWRQYWVRFRSSNLKVTYRSESTAPWVSKDAYEPVDQDSLDHILDKVATSGYESLSPVEKQQLFNAGR